MGTFSGDGCGADGASRRDRLNAPRELTTPCCVWSETSNRSVERSQGKRSDGRADAGGTDPMTAVGEGVAARDADG